MLLFSTTQLCFRSSTGPNLLLLYLLQTFDYIYFYPDYISFIHYLLYAVNNYRF
jgi:hypothetical protein